MAATGQHGQRMAYAVCNTSPEGSRLTTVGRLDRVEGSSTELPMSACGGYASGPLIG